MQVIHEHAGAMLNQLVDTEVVKGAAKHMMVAEGWCDYATRQECSEALEKHLSETPTAMFRFMFDYWFYGFFWVVFASPFLLIDMPIRAAVFANDETSLPKWTDDGTRFGSDFFTGFWNWYNLYTARLFLPYHFFIKVNLEHEKDLDVSDLNLRYMDGEEASEYFLISWALLIPIVAQAIVMYVATFPLYLVYFINWLVMLGDGSKDEMQFM